MTDTDRAERRHVEIRGELRLQRAMLVHLIAALESIALTAHTLETGDARMAKQLKEFVTELQSRVGKLTEDLKAQTTVVGAVKTLVTGSAAQIAALKQQVQDLVAAGTVDATVLQPIVDAIDATEKALVDNTAGLVQAVVQGTPAEAPAGTTPLPTA